MADHRASQTARQFSCHANWPQHQVDASSEGIGQLMHVQWKHHNFSVETPVRHSWTSTDALAAAQEPLDFSLSPCHSLAPAL